jgi:hypothetical protein
MTRKNLKKFSIMKWQKWVNSLFIVFLISSNTTAQEVIKISRVEGIYPISKEISISKARLNAIDEAKITALKMAGVEENIASFQSLLSSQQNKDFKQYFNAQVQSEIKGSIKSIDIIEDTIMLINHILSYKITLNADVIKYKSISDPTFNFKIDGVKAIYNVGDNLTFNFEASQDGYLYIFNIEENEASFLFPNSFEKNNFISKEVLYKFPQSRVDYELTSNNTKDGVNQFLFVLTKKRYPFLGANNNQNISIENVLSWVYNIELNQRKINFISLIVRK